MLAFPILACPRAAALETAATGAANAVSSTPAKGAEIRSSYWVICTSYLCSSATSSAALLYFWHSINLSMYRLSDEIFSCERLCSYHALGMRRRSKLITSTSHPLRVFRIIVLRVCDHSSTFIQITSDFVSQCTLVHFVVGNSILGAKQNRLLWRYQRT